jgi:hypothetical protein
MREPGICRLCQQSGELQESHMIPKFVIDWMRETGSAYFRRATTPNLRMQDGPKEKLLCADCEGRSSKDEALFAERVFRPYITEPRRPIPYEAFLIRFLVSICWRVVVSATLARSRTNRDFEEQLSEAEEEWRRFLLGKGELKKYDRVHLFLTDVTEMPVLPVHGLNQYLARALDSCIPKSKNDCAIYAKFTRFIVWAEITQFDPKNWENTRIASGRGILTGPQRIHDGDFGDFLVDRARQGLERLRTDMSERQRTIIRDRFLKDGEKLMGTDFGRAFEADMEAHVDPHTWIGRKIGRNEMCPCGSGNKYKRCHGGGDGSR